MFKNGARILGSSPLARGLLWRPVRVGGVGRIIPARAGFTCVTGVPAWAWEDHPRSRGVYSALRSDFVRNKWIIPARAGFTRVTRMFRGPCWDHPRSRGVY